MCKKVTSLVTGILFGLSLAVVGYFFLVISIALGIGKVAFAEVFLYMSFLFYPLALISVIGSILVLTKPKSTRIMLLIPLIYFVINAIYVFIAGAFSIGYLILILIVFSLGLTSTILSFLIKPKTSSNVIIKANTIEILNDSVILNNEESNNKE